MSVAAVLLAALFWGAGWLDSRLEKPETRGDHTLRYEYENLTELDDITYRPRRDVTAILLMGIDTAETGVGARGYRDGGQADFLRLIVMDAADRRVTQIQIDRDTMTPITVLGIMGNKSGMRTAQISLSHGFGDGRERSCELTVEAVSNLMFGIPIDGYVAMNLDGIAAFNDQLGGVTVTLEDDFSAFDPAMTKGATLTLTGKQAEYYVRQRMAVGVGTNEGRMARQEQYISQLMELLFARMGEDKEFVGTLYDALSPYLTTNLSRGRIINEAWAAKDCQRTEALKPAGVHKVGEDGFMQFWLDEAALRQTVIDLFYTRVK